ncbi:MAG: phage tail sheath subtilisin-like domain-containing protein [Gammaproteobacteria bacterium]|nr:phage tail sheath subtilisin-like domain-containing protein [Gammaproteobacteria bacterium]
MPVSFNNIPANLRVPLFYAEVDNSQASYFSRQNRTLLFGYLNNGTDTGGTATANQLVICPTTDQAKTLFGSDSMLAKMHAAYRNNDPFGEVWCMPITVPGTGDPDLTAAIAALGDEEYDYIAVPFNDTVNLDAMKVLMNDSTGRWSWTQQVYGHVYCVKKDTLANLQTLGSGRNDAHTTIFGIEADVVSEDYEYLAARVGREAVFLNADPARPTQTGELIGITGAPVGKRFTMTERQTLLNNGIATHLYSSDGAVRIERSITTYQENAWGEPDPSFLDSETLHQLAYILRFLRQRITQKFPRHKVANDGTRFGGGQAIVTPKIIRAELVAGYSHLERNGIVENAAAFAANLIVERDDNDPNRLNVLYPPDLVNQLRVFAVLAQFRLQYPAETA